MVCVKVYVNHDKVCDYSQGECPVSVNGAPAAAGSMSDPGTLPFAGPPDEVDGIDVKGLDPATIALIMQLIEMGMKLLAQWLANRKKRKAA